MFATPKVFPVLQNKDSKSVEKVGIISEMEMCFVSNQQITCLAKYLKEDKHDFWMQTASVVILPGKEQAIACDILPGFSMANVLLILNLYISGNNLFIY